MVSVISINTQDPSPKPKHHVYAVFANDNTKGLSHKLFKDATVELKEQGHIVDEVSLYDHANDIPFFFHSKEKMESNKFYMQNQKRFLQADTLLLVFPMYWYSMPAIMKAWVDMINAWAYKYEKNGSVTPLHSIQKVIIIYTSMMDRDSLAQEIDCSIEPASDDACNFLSMPHCTTQYSKQLHYAIESQWKETCKFLSIPNCTIHHVDSVYNLPAEKLEKHVAEIKTSCHL